MNLTRLRRRRVLTLVAAAAAGFAGCAGGEDASGADEVTATTAPESTPDGPTATDARAATDSTDLDLREANVVGVRVQRADDGYRFDVTLLHDDDAEDGYANWWQVETLAGEQVGRRELLHAHGTQEFTRSAAVSIPSGTTCVVVRGHDRTHGYGGQAMVVNVETGATRAVRQGAERASAAGEGC